MGKYFTDIREIEKIIIAHRKLNSTFRLISFSEDSEGVLSISDIKEFSDNEDLCIAKGTRISKYYTNMFGSFLNCPVQIEQFIRDLDEPPITIHSHLE